VPLAGPTRAARPIRSCLAQRRPRPAGAGGVWGGALAPSACHTGRLQQTRQPSLRAIGPAHRQPLSRLPAGSQEWRGAW
jgi:hypothetical protein